MRIRTDALRDSMRAPMPTLAQKDAERDEIQRQIEQFKAAGNQAHQVAAGETGRAHNRGRQALTVVSTGFMGADFVTSKAANARGGKC